eukprot:g5284.t1
MLRSTIYEFAVVLGCLLAFIASFGIGANDAANAFATSIGSEAITFRQAIVLSAICEFSGAVLVGSHVEKTIRENIVNPMDFKNEPHLLMYGMLCVLAASGIWLLFASYLGIPVSTTHSLVAGIVGMAVVANGIDTVVWLKENNHTNSLERYSGVIAISVSWVTSPILSGLIAALMFCFLRTFLLVPEAPLQRTYLFFPGIVWCTVTTNIYFIIFKGFKKKFNGKTLRGHLSCWSHLLAIGIGALCASFVACVVVPRLKRRTHEGNLTPPQIERQQSLLSQRNSSQSSQGSGRSSSDLSVGELLRKLSEKIFERDVHAVIQEDSTIKAIHERTETFDSNKEMVFRYLQVFTAMCDAFAHGANDVANSIGPLTVILGVYNKKPLEESMTVETWILVLGGIGIVVGLVTYGFNVIRSVGVKLTKITYSRGFSTELGSSIVVILGSHYGIPLSTTYCQVGAIVGVGLLEKRKGVNIKLFLKVIAGWIVTLVFVSLLAAGFFAQGAYAPSIINLRDIDNYRNHLNDYFAALNNSDTVTLHRSDIEEILGCRYKFNSNTSECEVESVDYQLGVLNRLIEALQ